MSRLLYILCGAAFALFLMLSSAVIGWKVGGWVGEYQCSQFGASRGLETKFTEGGCMAHVAGEWRYTRPLGRD